RTASEALKLIGGDAVVDQLLRFVWHELPSCNRAPNDEAATRLLTALPARATIGACILTDDVRRSVILLCSRSETARTRTKFSPRHLELLFIDLRDLLHRLLSEIDDPLHELVGGKLAMFDVAKL